MKVIVTLDDEDNPAVFRRVNHALSDDVLAEGRTDYILVFMGKHSCNNIGCSHAGNDSKKRKYFSFSSR